MALSEPGRTHGHVIKLEEEVHMLQPVNKSHRMYHPTVVTTICVQPYSISKSVHVVTMQTPCQSTLYQYLSIDHSKQSLHPGHPCWLLVNAALYKLVSFEPSYDCTLKSCCTRLLVH